MVEEYNEKEREGEQQRRWPLPGRKHAGLKKVEKKTTRKTRERVKTWSQYDRVGRNERAVLWNRNRKEMPDGGMRRGLSGTFVLQQGSSRFGRATLIVTRRSSVE
jgi:hypothetical protein